MSESPVCRTPEFAPAMLRGLTSLAPSAHSLPDLALELGLTAWMRFSGTDLETAQATMLTARSAVLEVGEMDSSTEPIPFAGRSPRLDILHLAAYLGHLIERAASSADCEPNLIAERAIERLAA